MMESDGTGGGGALSDEAELHCRVMVAELGNMVIHEHTGGGEGRRVGGIRRRRGRKSRRDQEEVGEGRRKAVMEFTKPNSFPYTVPWWSLLSIWKAMTALLTLFGNCRGHASR